MKKSSFSKRIVSSVITLTMLFSMLTSFSVFAREYAADFSINGETVAFVNQAYSKNDIIYIPLEEICGYLNLKTSREGDAYTISRLNGEMKVQLGNLAVFFNGEEIKLSSHPEEKNGIAYVPAELFSKGFGCPVTVADDKRSADIVPNVYKVAITEENAAATSATSPDKDVLATGTSSNDVIFNNLTNFSQMEKSLYYNIDLSAFEALEIEKVLLGLNIDKAEYNPTLRIVRTAPFSKGAVTYNTPPAEYTEYITGNVAESNFVDKQYNITTLASAAKKSGEALAIKLMGIPHSSKMTSKNNSFSIKGVNTSKAPHVVVYVKESYTFPIKTADNTDESEEYSYSRLGLLKSLGVFTESDEFPLDMGEGVQRHEFVKYALRLKNTQAGEENGGQFFSDVPVDAPFYSDVMTAYASGLVAGWQGIAFRPYDRITLGEAITILGRILNYNIFADERGGFTPGYFAAARNGDLYNGAQIEKEELSFRKMFSLLEDALDAKMLNVRSYSSNGNAEYTFDENKTILSEYWNASVIEDTVTANEYSSLTAGGSGSENTIVIGGKKLTLNFSPYNQFLGYKVKAYYDRYEDKLLYMGIKEYDITEIDIADITGASKSGSTISFTYKRENGKYGQESFSLTTGKYVVYNGKTVSAGQLSTALLNADSGSVKLVSDSLTVITAYKTLVVSSVNLAEETIYDAYDAYDRSLKLENKEWSITDKEGKSITLDSVNKNDVISKAESLDGEIVNAIISSKSVTGEISAVKDLGSDDAVLTIAGIDYSLSNQTRVTGNAEYWTDYLKLGLSGTFLIDFEGKIAGIVTQKDAGIIGYLLTMGYKGSSLNKKLQAAVVVKDSDEYVVYDLADKVEIDCRKFKKHEDIEAYFTEDSAIKKQPIIFDLNSEGKIKKINTPTLGTENGRVVEDEDENLIHRHKSTDEDMNYKSSGIYGGKFFLAQGDNMIVAKGGEEFEDYVVKSSLATNEFYYIDVWTIGNKSPEAVVALVEQSSTPSIGDDPLLYLVDRVVFAYDSDGMEVKKLYYYTGVDTIKSVIVDSKYESAVDGFKRGDIIRFSTNTHGRLHAAKEYYDYETKTLNTRVGGYNTKIRVSGGYVGRIDKTYVQLVDYNAADIGNPAEGKMTKEFNGTTYTDYEYTWHDGKRFKNIFSYEANSAGVTVKKETLDSIRTYEDVPYNPHGLILNAAYENIRANVWLIEMKQPENTGIYKVSYSGGEHSDAENVPEGFVRYNPGAEADITDKTPTYDQYTFTGWKVNNEGELLNHGDKVTVNGDTELVAQWVYTPTLKFTFTAGEGTGESFQVPYALKKTDLVTNASHDLPKAADNGAKDFVAPAGKVLGGWALLNESGETVKEYKYNIVQNKFDAQFAPAEEGYADAETGGTFKAIWTDTYEIATADELKWFAANGNESMNVKLTDDIYLNNFTDNSGNFDEDWYETADNVANASSWKDYRIEGFAGEFNGNNHTIYGLYLEGGDGTGFFSSVSSGAVIKDVKFKGAYIVSTSTSAKNVHSVSVVCAEANGKTTFNNVSTQGKIVPKSTSNYVASAGGIVSQIRNTTGEPTIIENCISEVDIDARGGGTTYESAGNFGSGGIVGTLYDSSGTAVTITGCISNGDLIQPYSWKSAGIIGNCLACTTTVTNCTNNGTIKYYKKGSTPNAQIVGHGNNSAAKVTVNSCTANGSAGVYTAE